MSKIYVVVCPNHDKQILSYETYLDTMRYPKMWRCPQCNAIATFDDVYNGTNLMGDNDATID